MTVPANSDCLLKPRRSSALGAPASTIQFSTLPSGFLMSMWIHACGLIHSIEVTVPVNFTGFWASYSAANEWCAMTGTAARRRPAPRITTDSFARIGFASCMLRSSRTDIIAPLLHRPLAQMAVQHLFGELDALELEQLCVLLDAYVQRHADLPRPRKHLVVLDRGLVIDVVRAGHRETLDDVGVVGRVVADPVEPRMAVQALHVHDEGITFPLAV